MGASKATTTSPTSAALACPSESVVLDFAEGRETPERELVARHITECDDCRRLVGVLAASRDGSASRASQLTTPAAGLLEPGTLIANKYEVVSIIGRGGMGVVVEALHRTLRQRVALKFLVGPLARDPAAVSRFFREARAAATLGSEHVVRVLDADWLPSGEPFIALELLEGRDLAAELRARGPLPIPEAVAHVLEACEALALAHKHGIVHRDIKPANLFLTRGVDGSALVKVLDFGIAKVRAKDESGTGQTDPSALVGSPRYMAPEQLRASAEVDARADIWALAVTLFELISGRVPFDGDNILEICARIITGPPARLEELRPDVPGGLAQALARALERDAAKRTPTVLALAEDIAPFAPPSSHTGLERLRRITRTSLAPPQLGPPASTPSPLSFDAAFGSDSTVAASLTPSVVPSRRSPLALVGGALAVVLAVGTAFVIGASRAPVPAGEQPAAPAQTGTNPAAEAQPPTASTGAEPTVRPSAAPAAIESTQPSSAPAVSVRARDPLPRPRATGAASAAPATPPLAQPAPPAAPTSTGGLHRDGLLDRK